MQLNIHWHLGFHPGRCTLLYAGLRSLGFTSMMINTWKCRRNVYVRMNKSELMSINMQINKREKQISYIPGWYSTAWWAHWYFSRTGSQSCHCPRTTLFLVILKKWDWGKQVLAQWVCIHFWSFRSILCWSSNNTWVKASFYVYFFILNWYTTMIA